MTKDTSKSPKEKETSDGAVLTAYRYIRAAIISGDLQAGEKLRENTLAELIGVSRTPTREALRRLSNEGLVVMERYRRAQVAKFSREEIAEIFYLRAKLEGHGARRAAMNITQEQIAHLEAIELEMEQVFSELGWHQHLAQFDKLNTEFHATIAQAAASPRLEKILASSLELPASILIYYNEPVEERTKRTHRQHQEIIDALKTRNPDWAEAAMNAHLFSILGPPGPEEEE